MVKKCKMRTAVSSLVLCIFLCSCGEAKGREVMVIGQSSTESYDAGREADAPGSGAATVGTSAEGAAGSGREEAPAETEVPRILVHVCGAVKNPGVVSLPEGSRAEDALLLAGGFAEDASWDYVNLAERVNDGEKLYFPTVEEVSKGLQPPEEAEDGLVNINTADVAALCTLPGIGESRARDIIAYREANGAFESCEDIMKVSGIKTSVYSKISDRIKVK